MKITNKYSKKFVAQLWKKSKEDKSIVLNKPNGSMPTKKEMMKLLEE